VGDEDKDVVSLLSQYEDIEYPSAVPEEGMRQAALFLGIDHPHQRKSCDCPK